MFSRKCSCGNKSSHEQKLATMGGNITLRWCGDCWDKKQETERLQKEKWSEQFKVEREEKEKQRRYEYLKREIELVELEKKAKELGIG